MSERLTVVAERVGYPTYAAIFCDRTETISNASQLLSAVSRAVTKWVKTTDAGTTAYNARDQYFDVGDLANELSDSSLVRCLEEQGVYGIDIDVFDADRLSRMWTFDTKLVDDEQLSS